MRARGEKVADAKGVEIDMKKPNPPNAKGRAEATAQLAELDDLIQDLKTEMRVTEEVGLFVCCCLRCWWVECCVFIDGRRCCTQYRTHFSFSFIAPFIHHSFVPHDVFSIFPRRL